MPAIPTAQTVSLKITNDERNNFFEFQGEITAKQMDKILDKIVIPLMRPLEEIYNTINTQKLLDEKKTEEEKPAEIVAEAFKNFHKEMQLEETPKGKQFGIIKEKKSEIAVSLENVKTEEVVNNTEKQEFEDFHRTGIKYNVQGKPKYRLEYDCPHCTHSGRHYIPHFTKIVSCHECQSKLLVEPSTENGFGIGDKFRDERGNFFVAESLYIDDLPMYEREERGIK
jgi:hypothetical protein